MVPVLSLEATSSAFVVVEVSSSKVIKVKGPKLHGQTSGVSLHLVLEASIVSYSSIHLTVIAAPALRSVVIPLLIEIPCASCNPFAVLALFAKFLSGSDEAAAITAMMWRHINWCSTILLATQTR